MRPPHAQPLFPPPPPSTIPSSHIPPFLMDIKGGGWWGRARKGEISIFDRSRSELGEKCISHGEEESRVVRVLNFED